MTSFLERYQQGEYEEVWAELLALGEQVRHEPLYADALAVAYETMRRVGFNIELLLPRLRVAGYQFGYGWLTRHGINAAQVVVAVEEVEREAQPPYGAPQLDSHARVAELEQLVGGPIPLSLQAWYEVVGHVNFVGDLPSRWGFTPGTEARERSHVVLAPPAFPTPSAQPERPPPRPAREENIAAFWEAVEASYAEDPEGKVAEARHAAWVKSLPPPLDPLFINSIEEVLWEVKFQLRNRQHFPVLSVPLAPGAVQKYFISGGGSYRIFVPTATMDGKLVAEWHDATFVEYLRLCFRWAGLPGLAYFAEERGKEELQALTEGLLPL